MIARVVQARQPQPGPDVASQVRGNRERAAGAWRQRQADQNAQGHAGQNLGPKARADQQAHAVQSEALAHGRTSFE